MPDIQLPCNLSFAMHINLALKDLYYSKHNYGLTNVKSKEVYVQQSQSLRKCIELRKNAYKYDNKVVSLSEKRTVQALSGNGNRGS